MTTYFKGWIKPGNYGVEKSAEGVEYIILYRWWERILMRIIKPIQKGLWFIGVAVHDPIFGECTPDFNCCCDCGRKRFIYFSS